MAKELLRSSNYWTLNKTLVKKLGIETAFLLTNLIEAEHLMKTVDGWFFQTIEKLEDVSTLSRHKQESSIEKLKNIGIVQVEVKGLPAKRYFKIDENALKQYILEETQFVKNSQTGMQKINKQDCEKLATSKESTYKESTYKSSSSVYQFYQQNFGQLSPFLAESIDHWINDLSSELVIESLKIALKNGKPFKYAEGIMKDWLKNNVRTLCDVHAKEVSFSSKTKRKKEAVDIEQFNLDD